MQNGNEFGLCCGVAPAMFLLKTDMKRRTFLINGISMVVSSVMHSPAAAHTLVEVIASSLEEAITANTAGASRIELAVDLKRGGITPPLALVQQVMNRIRIPTRVMLRALRSLPI